jgi:hypothetical protein
MVSVLFFAAAASSQTYTTASHGTWFLRNWHIDLPEEGTQVTKHVGEIYLTYVLIRNCVFGWYN